MDPWTNKTLNGDALRLLRVLVPFFVAFVMNLHLSGLLPSL
jgi:hypothetical protein